MDNLQPNNPAYRKAIETATQDAVADVTYFNACLGRGMTKKLAKEALRNYVLARAMTRMPGPDDGAPWKSR